MSRQLKGRVRAPELVGHRGWLNTDGPLTLAALRGKVVLLDFWTYGCINCVHIIPDLKRLEERYANQLVVIGVHSAKFENEKETENIRRIVLRYGVEHPVVNDAEFKIWESYAVRAWPTQVLIDPAGYVVGWVEGEGHYEELDGAISQLVEEFRRRGELNEQPLALALERAKTSDLPLAFPGKVLADERGGRLFISDSNHNRVVVTRLDGTLIETIGAGAAGARDGAFDEATFNRPQGLALDVDDTLYVADTSNHLVRRVDLKGRRVSTVAGTGKQGRGRAVEAKGAPALSTALSSPWDVHLVGEGPGRRLLIAMAGPHQIWAYDPARAEVAAHAGSGREARLDGPASEAGFAQPSGLAADGKTLYVADSESNIIRAVEAGRDEPRVRTLAGGDLFEFGDADGRGDDVRLQHPLGLAYAAGRLYIADTYNHKIKRLDPRNNIVETFAGTGKPGQEDGARASFYEPGGLSAAGGRLYVADTNNHAVRVIDLHTKETLTLRIEGLQPPALPESAATDANAAAASSTGPGAEETKLAPQRLRAGAGASLSIEVALPAGYHLNPSAPQRYNVAVTGGAESVAVVGANAADVRALTRSAKDLRLPLRISLLALSPGASELTARVTLFYCREDNTGTCRIKTLAWRLPVQVVADAGAPREVKLSGAVE